MDQEGHSATTKTFSSLVTLWVSSGVTDFFFRLGLTLVKGVVDAQKGKVRVESSEGNGTSFILEIPFGEQSKAAAWNI